MKKCLLLIAVIILTGNLYAQAPQGMPGNNAIKEPANMGHVYGKLTDADGKPLNGASVMLMQKKIFFILA